MKKQRQLFIFIWAVVQVCKAGISHYQEIDGWAAQLVHFQALPITPSNPETFTYIPSKSVGPISSACLSLAGFSFQNFKQFRFQAYFSINDSSVQISITADTPTTVIYLNYYILYSGAEVDAYFFHLQQCNYMNNLALTLTNCVTNTNTLRTDNVRLSIPVQRIVTGMTDKRVMNIVSFKGKVYNEVGLLKFTLNSLSYILADHEFSMNIRCDQGSITQITASILILNYTQAKKQIVPLSYIGVNKQSPINYLIASSIEIQTVIANNFYLPTDQVPNYHKSYISMISILLCGRMYSDYKEFSYQFDQNGFHNLTINLFKRYDSFLFVSNSISLAFCQYSNQYFLAGGTACSVCTLTPNCLTCNSSTGCGKCKQGYFVDGSVCTACPLVNCSLCLTISQCQICEDGFYKNTGGTCSHCSDFLPQCIKCTGQFSCVMCSDNYYVVGLACQSCSIPLSNCVTCDNSTVCTGCITGYYTQGLGCLLCAASITNCLSCLNSTICLSCSPSFFPNNSQCLECSGALSSCIQCNNNNTCTKCVSDLYMVNSQGKCKLCSEELSNCVRCLNKNVCLSCGKGYFTEGSGCISCGIVMEGCTACSSSTKCDDQSSGSSDIDLSALQDLEQRVNEIESGISDLNTAVLMTLILVLVMLAGLIALLTFIFKKMQITNSNSTDQPQIEEQPNFLKQSQTFINFEEVEETPQQILESKHRKRRRKRKTNLKNQISNQQLPTSQLKINQISFDKELQNMENLQINNHTL